MDFVLVKPQLSRGSLLGPSSLLLGSPRNSRPIESLQQLYLEQQQVSSTLFHTKNS